LTGISGHGKLLCAISIAAEDLTVTHRHDMKESRGSRREDSESVFARQTASLAALALTLALVVAGLFLVNALRAPAQSDDYLLARGTPVAW
jgi:hypothetical protein